jgi:hypothetical protein
VPIHPARLQASADEVNAGIIVLPRPRRTDCDRVGESMSSFAPHVLVEESGRRRRVLRLVGRAVSVLLLIWLGVLALAWLGIEPLGNLGVSDPGISRATPPALPARIESAVAGGRIVAPPHSVAGTSGARPIPAGARSGEASGHPGNLHRRPAPASNANPGHKRLPAGGSIPSNTGTAPSSARAQTPAVRSGKKSPQAGAANPGKSQSSPGHAKRPATAPSSTSSPGKSTTSPGHTKEPGQTSARPAPGSQGSTGANGLAVGIPHNRTTTSPAP